MNYYEEKYHYEKKNSNDSMNESNNNNNQKKDSNDTLLSQNTDPNFKTYYYTVEKETDDELGIELAENEGPYFIDYESNHQNVQDKDTKVSKSLNHVNLNYSSTNNKKINVNRLRRHKTSEFKMNNDKITVKTSNHIFISHVRSTSIFLDKLKFVYIIFHIYIILHNFYFY